MTWLAIYALRDQARARQRNPAPPSPARPARRGSRRRARSPSPPAPPPAPPSTAPPRESARPPPAAASDSEPDQLEHLRQRLRQRPGPRPDSLPPTSSNTSAIARGVLKSSASASRNASSRDAGGEPGEVPPEPPRCCSDGTSPGSPRRPRYRVLPEEVPQPLDLRHRLLHLLRPERQRLPVVPRDQVGDDRLAPVAVERLARAGRCCPPISTSSRRRSRPSRCASRSGRTGRPAASDWAISFSWWGKTRSEPPPWIAKEAPSSCSAITEHSMCQAGPPRAPGRVPGGVLALLVSPSRGRSRARSSLSEAEPASSPWSMSSGRRLESLP